MYAKCKPAQEASIEYVNSSQHQFDINGTPYRMSISEDYQKPVGSRAEMKKATSIKLIHRINSKVKEPPKMIMFRWAQYEATVNGVGMVSHNYLLCQIFHLKQRFLENTQSRFLLHLAE